MQPPIVSEPAAAGAATTPVTVRHASPTTTAVAETAPKAPAEQTVTLAEVWPPNHDPGRVYVSARGQDPGAYVSHMTIDWGDGTAARNFDYPLSSCQTGTLQAADANHAYAAPGRYPVTLVVTSVACDGTGSRLATAETTVTYPSSPPSG